MIWTVMMRTSKLQNIILSLNKLLIKVQMLQSKLIDLSLRSNWEEPLSQCFCVPIWIYKKTLYSLMTLESLFKQMTDKKSCTSPKCYERKIFSSTQTFQELNQSQATGKYLDSKPPQYQSKSWHHKQWGRLH